MSKKIPVLVLAFNRADHVAEAMKAIREYKPDRLYLECDGPRAHKEGEREAVEETRQTMLDAVDWSCEVKTLFREENLGCAKAVYGAITWFFEQEEYGVIIEDDIVMSQDFFRLCEDLLPRYKDEERVMEIVSQNHSHRTDISDTYVYSWREHCWGWASWRRAWAKMDFSMSAVPGLTNRFMFKKLGWFEGWMKKRYFESGYRNIENFKSWAFRWSLSILVNEGLVIIPGVNLSKNIGTDGGVHYEAGDVDPYAHLQIGKMVWPLQYNDTFTIDKKQDKYDRDDFWRIRMIGLRKKVRKMMHLNKKLNNTQVIMNKQIPPPQTRIVERWAVSAFRAEGECLTGSRMAA